MTMTAHNLVSPRQTEFINRNWADLTDSDGTPIVDEFISARPTGRRAGTALCGKNHRPVKRLR